MLLDLFKPRERIDAAEWAESNVVLERSGKFSFKTRPFFEEPTKAMSDTNHCCRVVISSSAQLGKTTMLLNMLGWIATQDPNNTLMVMDSQKSMTKLVKNRARPFLRDCAHVKSLQRGGTANELDKSSSAVNISLRSGANLIFGSSKSLSDLCSMPCKYVLADEVGRFVDNNVEGDPIELLKVRMMTYPNSMLLLTSTPTTVDGTITQNYLVGTQEVWGPVCECGKHLTIPYKDIDFSDPENPTYACPECGQVYSECDIKQLRYCYSKPQNPNPVMDKAGRVVRSFDIHATCCPEVYSWKALRQQEIEARSKGLSSYKSFTNVVLGLPYYPGVDEALDIDQLLRLKTFFTKDSLPNWVHTITIGIDTQDNRFEWLVVGFSKRGNHKCFIEHGKILGDLKEQQVWTDLKEFISTYKCIRKDGAVLYPSVICPDSGGHFTQDIYALSLLNNRIKPVKGYATTNTRLENSIIKHTTEVPIKALGSGVGRTTLTIVNTVYAKDIIRADFLKLQSADKEKSLYVSRDVSAGFDAEFFSQMDSEIREETRDGRARWVYKGTNRNEMLDCAVYALAAFEIYRLATGNVADFAEKDIEIDKVPEDLDLATLLAEERSKTPSEQLLNGNTKQSATAQETNVSGKETAPKRCRKRLL